MKKITKNMKNKLILIVFSCFLFIVFACNNSEENHYEIFNNDSLFDESFQNDNNDESFDRNYSEEKHNNFKFSLSNDNSCSNIVYFDNFTPEEKIQYGLQNKYSIEIELSEIKINNVKRADNQNVFEASVYSKEFESDFNVAWFDANKTITDDYAFYFYENMIHDEIDNLISETDNSNRLSYDLNKPQCFENYINYDLQYYLSNSGMIIEIGINEVNDTNIDEISEFIEKLNEHGYFYKVKIHNYKDNQIEFDKNYCTDLKIYLSEIK